jgi:hypothetical protein
MNVSKPVHFPSALSLFDIAVQSTETQSVHEEEDDLIAREKALVRKLDRRIMPILTLLYICQRLDLSNIGNAKVRKGHLPVSIKAIDFIFLFP